MELNYNENNISISYFLPDYTKIGVITYLYKMDGVNEEWNVGSTEGYTIYTMLKPGKYTFRVKAVNSDGSFTEESTIPFIIKKPFWRSSIAYCIYISLALIITIFILYRVKFMKRLIDNQTKEINRQLEENKRLYERNIRNEKFKNDYFVNLSHELRTPLNIFYSTVQLLDLKSNDMLVDFREVYEKHKQCLNLNCKRMLRLIDNIVDITKIDVGFTKAKFANCDIVRVIEEITLSVVNYAENKNINIVFDTEIEEHIIKCDSSMIERAMLNLLSNAIKFTKENGNIVVNLYKDEQWVHIIVKDDGIGIPIGIQGMIFERFVQGDKSLTRLNEGSGIGLSIVKSIVELNNGEIYLDSDGENGTEFEILLPNEKLEGDKYEYNYEIDIDKIELEFSDIYELYS